MNGLVNKFVAICFFSLAVSPTSAQTTNEENKKDIADLDSKIVLLEQSLAQLKAQSEAISSHQPKDHPSQYGDTVINVGGYVKVDALISNYSNAAVQGVGEDFFIPSTIRTSGESVDNKLNLHAKETRFWLKSSTPSKFGDIKTHFEIDFLLGQQGDERVGNSFSPRIRHASISLNRWTVGQTWTNFFNTASLPEYLDFLGPVGVAFARQVQVRYTLPTENGSWLFSLENPETTLTPYTGGARIDADDSLFPDVIVRRNWKSKWSNMSVAVMLRELKIQENGFDDSTVGGAIGLAGKFLLPKQADIRWQINYGDALGRYMGLNSYNVGALDADGDIDKINQYGALIAYRHVWNEALHSSVGLSFSKAENIIVISGANSPESYESAHINLIWSPVPRMSIGAEYIYGSRTDESNADGSLNRIQFSAKYNY